MHLFQLNYDVLSEIIAAIRKPELPKFILASHLAHDLAMPYLVSTVHLHRDHQQVLGFCHFMLSDPLRWIPMLRVLRILDGACVDPTCDTSSKGRSDTISGKPQVSSRVLAGSLLADVLKYACNLNCLRVDQIESLLERAPQIGGAIIFCPKLTTVHFFGMGQRSRDMMVNMIGLRHIDIHHEGDVTTLLRPFQSTLEEVSCMSPHVDHQCLEFDEVYRWPRVHTLHLGNHSKNKVIKQKLARAFPNLHNLLLPPRVLSTDHTARSLNESSECWPRLDYVQGTLVELYNLALSCPVRELNVRGVVYSPSQNGTAAMFLDLVRATRPVALSFSVSEALLDTSFYETFSRFVPNLAFLEIAIIYGPASFSQQLDCVSRSLDSVPIVYLSLRLLYISRLVDLSESERMLIVDHISNSVPSVRYIELQWPEPHRVDIRRESPPSHRRWWHIVSDRRGGGDKFGQLSNQTGMAIRQEWTSYPIRGAVERALLTAF